MSSGDHNGAIEISLVCLHLPMVATGIKKGMRSGLAALCSGLALLSCGWAEL